MTNQNAVLQAFTNAIRTVGKESFKKTSLFATNELQEAKEDLSKAA